MSAGGVRSKPASITEVAAHAGVSASTVSNALNGKGRVSATTRERIAAAARELGYQPSRAARSLRTNRTGTLAFLVPSFDPEPAPERRLVSLDVYMTQATAAAQTAFVSNHALLLVPPTATAPDLHALGVDGGIVCDPLEGDELVGAFEDLGRPVVTIERDLGRPQSPWYVCSDNRANMLELLDHLAAAGARRIAFMTVDLPIAWAVESLGAYESWCAVHGHRALVVHTDPHAPDRDAYANASRLLDAPDRPDAIVASDERYPSGVIRAARERGLGIPSELLLATGIDSHEARQASPAVTAIDIDPSAQGSAAAELLIARLTEAAAEPPRITPAVLRVRASTLR